MRVQLTALAALLLLSVAPAQERSGMYRMKNGATAEWSVTNGHSLLWNNSPYLPCGVCIDGSAAEVQRVAKAGIKDLMVDLPSSGTGWGDTLAALEGAGATYMLRVSSLAPMAEGVAVEPQGYRVVGLMGNEKLDIDLPGCKNAFVILVTRRDMSVTRAERLPVKDSKLHYEVPEGNGLESVLLIYPVMASLDLPDFWEGLDAQRDDLLASLRRTPPGAGFRGIVNPMGRMLRLPGRQSRFVPTSPFFRYELRDFLERKYKNLDTLQRAWAVPASPLDSFDAYSRLVPLWSGNRGIPQLWDVKTDQLYMTDSKRSAIWRDLDEVILQAGAKRIANLVAAIQGSIDVPVIQEWAGWAAPYDTKTPAFTGLGMRSEGVTPSAVIESTCRAVSSVLRWQNNGALLATEINLGPAPSESLAGVLDELTSIGARGWFVRADSDQTLRAVAEVSSRFTSNAFLATDSPLAIFFPENATNPAVAQRLTGSNWWLPSPASGNRIDLGKQFFAYRLQDNTNSYVAIWSSLPTQRVKLRMANAKTVGFKATDGQDPDPKLVKGGVEVTMGQSPLLILGTDEIPVPEPALKEVQADFNAVISASANNRDVVAEEMFFFGDALKGFDRNPGGSFVAMRQQYLRALAKTSSFTWIEAENPQATSFSDVQSVPGCSGGSALILDTQLPPLDKLYTATYVIPVRTNSDQEVWLAARIPEEYRKSIKLTLGGQDLTLPEERLSPYGAGFAWFRLGTTRLAGNKQSFTIQVAAPNGADLAIDTILFMPGSFRPNGVCLPEPVRSSP